MHHTKLIQRLIDKHGYDGYLEIGIGNGAHFQRIQCRHKVGVDPAVSMPSVLRVTSDAFFSENKSKFDIIFIDGLHHAEQVEKDIANSLRALNPGGRIVVHDINPPSYAAQKVPREQPLWTGDVWRAWVGLREKYPGIECYAYPGDYGIGIIHHTDIQVQVGILTQMSWAAFQTNIDLHLNIKPMEHKRAIYTVITGNYDVLRPPAVRSAGFDYICFTDSPSLACDGWEMRRIEPGADPCRQQRAIKIMPHKYLPEYEQTVYVDGSIQLKADIAQLIDEQFSGNIMLKQHEQRRCIYQEGAACVRLNKVTAQDVHRQLSSYVAEGMPADAGLYATGIMIRDNRPDVNAIMEDWYREVEKYTHRDQLSLPVVLWRHGYKPQTIGPRTINRYYTLHRHAGNKGTPRIWYSTPFALDKNIGRAYNEFCEMVPDGDWICLRDGDTMFLHPHWGKQLQDIILRHGEEYALLGCITNRLRGVHQLYNNTFSDDPDILNHKRIADQLHADQYDAVKTTTSGVGGLLMLFPKSIWQKVKFQENTIHFDTVFSKEVLKHAKVGVMQGVYLFHWYRFDQPDPCNYKEHLL